MGMTAPVVAVIPARYQADRLPGKPLLAESGKFLIQHVYEGVTASGLFERVVIATDDERIEEAARSFGADVLMTSPDHPSGTDRVAEVARSLDSPLIVNVQGDEPEIPVEALRSVVDLLRGPGAEMVTAACPFYDHEDPDDPNRVKVVCRQDGEALYFSRARIPFSRGESSAEPLLHLGLYGYSRDTLEKLATLTPTPLERSERLEQLRALENGVSIRVAVLDLPPWGGIDTREDYERFLARTEGT
jgi:3-deoxy-manno-octulosonate cytidylyltransferase (CMP-KDO synthetase)